GDRSVISDPAKQQVIALDHLKKEARTFPMAPEIPIQPDASGLPAPVQLAPPADVQNLGQKFIDGHEAEGKRYVLKTPPPPKLPADVQPPVPSQAQIPELPNAPSLPGLPKPLAPSIPDAKLPAQP